MTPVETAGPLRWWRTGRGDLDAIIAQFGFNIGQMIIPAFLLLPLGISLEFTFTHMLPGFALGLLVGSSGLAALAVRMRKREGRLDVTSHVYGNNVPAILAYTLSIMLPVFLQTHDEYLAWRIGAAAVVWTGIIKLLAAPFAGKIRRVIPVPASMTVFGAAMYSFLALSLLQRIFDQPLVGLVALMVVAVCALGNVPITKWRVPPFLVTWIVPLVLGVSIGYIRPVWSFGAMQAPFVVAGEPLRALVLALPYMSVIVPIAIYQLLQDVAAVEGASAAGDNYDARSVILCDGIGTLLCGVAGSVVTPIIYAFHPSYKAIGARVGFAVWTPVIFILVVISGLTRSFAQLFPWPILAAMIAYVAVGVGTATLRRVESKYWSAVLLGFVLPAGAVVSAAVNSALPALKLSAADPVVQEALNRSIFWYSMRGLGNGFLFLVLIIASVITETINRNFGRAAIWCLLAAVFSWVGLMHSATLRWGAEPMYFAGWLAAAAIAYSARWWSADSPPASAAR